MGLHVLVLLSTSETLIFPVVLTPWRVPSLEQQLLNARETGLHVGSHYVDES